ncbi:MAG: hypothetical protein ACPGJV_07325 [Bacteriovoracaceae bacterium]
MLKTYENKEIDRKRVLKEVQNAHQYFFFVTDKTETSEDLFDQVILRWKNFYLQQSEHQELYLLRFLRKKLKEFEPGLEEKNLSHTESNVLGFNLNTLDSIQWPKVETLDELKEITTSQFQREILFFWFKEGKDLKEVARILNVELSEVSKSIFDIVKTLEQKNVNAKLSSGQEFKEHFNSLLSDQPFSKKKYARLLLLRGSKFQTLNVMTFLLGLVLIIYGLYSFWQRLHSS